MSRRRRFLHVRRPTWASSLLPVEKQMLGVVAFYALLAPLTASYFGALRAVPLELLHAFALGVLLGAFTGLGLVVHERWRR